MSEGHERPAICWLDQAKCRDSALAGGKAAHLSRLTAVFRVPAGFCLTTAAFDHATFNGQVEDVAAQSRDKLANTLYEALTQAYVQLGERCRQVAPPVAVRSSAVDEDGISASFAGQHKTLLNIAGVEAIAQAAVQCWRSACSHRAQAYRIAREALARVEAKYAQKQDMKHPLESRAKIRGQRSHTNR